MIVGNVEYNDDWIKSFESEADFIKSASQLTGKTEDECKEIYRLLIPYIEPIIKEIIHDDLDTE